VGAPIRLSGKAKEKWQELEGCFDLSSPVHVETLCQACEQWATYLGCLEAQSAYGLMIEQTNGVIAPNGAIEAGRKAQIQFGKLLDRLPLKAKTSKKW
jgi:phage terminase small subunit